MLALLTGVAQAEGQTDISREYAQKSLALAERHKLTELDAEVEAPLKQKGQNEKTAKMMGEKYLLQKQIFKWLIIFPEIATEIPNLKKYNENFCHTYQKKLPAT